MKQVREPDSLQAKARAGLSCETCAKGDRCNVFAYSGPVYMAYIRNETCPKRM